MKFTRTVTELRFVPVAGNLNSVGQCPSNFERHSHVIFVEHRYLVAFL